MFGSGAPEQITTNLVLKPAELHSQLGQGPSSQGLQGRAPPALPAPTALPCSASLRLRLPVSVFLLGTCSLCLHPNFPQLVSSSVADRVHSRMPPSPLHPQKSYSKRGHVHKHRGLGLELLGGDAILPTLDAHRGAGSGLSHPQVTSWDRAVSPPLVRPGLPLGAHLGLRLVWGGDPLLPEQWQMSAGTPPLDHTWPVGPWSQNKRALAVVPQALSESLCHSRPCCPHGLGEH